MARLHLCRRDVDPPHRGGHMKNAYECEEEFNAKGQLLKRTRRIGRSVVWAILVIFVVLVSLIAPLPTEVFDKIRAYALLLRVLL